MRFADRKLSPTPSAARSARATAAAWLANKELSSTSSTEQSRSNPSPADQLDMDMKKGYPNSTTVGPANYELFRF